MKVKNNINVYTSALVAETRTQEFQLMEIAYLSFCRVNEWGTSNNVCERIPWCRTVNFCVKLFQARICMRSHIISITGIAPLNLIDVELTNVAVDY